MLTFWLTGQLIPAFQSSSSRSQISEWSSPEQPIYLPAEYHKVTLVSATWDRRITQLSPAQISLHKMVGYKKTVIFLNYKQ